MLVLPTRDQRSAMLANEHGTRDFLQGPMPEEPSSPDAPDSPELTPSNGPDSPIESPDNGPDAPEAAPPGAPSVPQAPAPSPTPSPAPAPTPSPAPAPQVPQPSPQTTPTPLSVPVQEPSTNPLTQPAPSQASSNITIYPLAHCWTHYNSKYYAYFGYEATGERLTESSIYNITGGWEANLPIIDFASGRRLLTFAIEADEEIVTLSFADQHASDGSEPAPSSGPTSQPPAVPALYIQSLNTSDTSRRCPNITLKFVLSYPNAADFGNLSSNVHQLLSDNLPYPFELITTSDADESGSKRDMMAAGDVDIGLVPDATNDPYYAYATGIGNNPPPSDSNTGEPASRARLTSAVPTTGGTSGSAPQPSKDEPPALSKFAKGAIAICVIVGVLIVIMAIALACMRKSDKLPTSSRAKQDKAIRKKNKKRNGDIEQGMSVPLTTAAVAHHEAEEEESDEEDDSSDNEGSSDEEEEVSEQESTHDEESSASASSSKSSASEPRTSSSSAH